MLVIEYNSSRSARPFDFNRVLIMLQQSEQFSSSERFVQQAVANSFKEVVQEFSYIKIASK